MWFNKVKRNELSMNVKQDELLYTSIPTFKVLFQPSAVLFDAISNTCIHD